MEKSADKKRRTSEITAILYRQYPSPSTALNFSNPLELLISTILSAQCTDKRVNIITEDLFKKYRSAKDYAEVDINELEQDISSCNLYKNKAANIKKGCQVLVEKYSGNVPRTLDELTALPGIGRKTANVVLGNAYGISEGVVVDTHVKRVSQRLKLTEHNDPEKIEQDFMELVPKDKWVDFSHLLIFHGREICIARKPKCTVCPINFLCPSRQDV